MASETTPPDPAVTRAGVGVLGHCRLFHRWERWGEVKIVSSLLDGKRVGQRGIQQRECQRCGQVEMKDVTPPL